MNASEPEEPFKIRTTERRKRTPKCFHHRDPTSVEHATTPCRPC